MLPDVLLSLLTSPLLLLYMYIYVWYMGTINGEKEAVKVEPTMRPLDDI